MLRDWQLHYDYQDSLRQNLAIHLQIERNSVESLDKAINKHYLLDLDNLRPIVSLYMLIAATQPKISKGLSDL